MSDSRSDHLENPQVPPVLQAEALVLYENDLPEFPAIRAANVDILRFTCTLLQLGQET